MKNLNIKDKNKLKLKLTFWFSSINLNTKLYQTKTLLKYKELLKYYLQNISEQEQTNV